MSKIALPLAAVGFCCFCIYMGGLASLQAQCYDTESTSEFGTHMLSGVWGFSATQLSCSKVYRFYWVSLS